VLVNKQLKKEDKYFNIIIDFLDIVHRPIFYLKIGRWMMSKNSIIVLIFHRHKLLDRINILAG
jgi:hypothetical protein